MGGGRDGVAEEIVETGGCGGAGRRSAAPIEGGRDAAASVEDVAATLTSGDAEIHVHRRCGVRDEDDRGGVVDDDAANGDGARIHGNNIRTARLRFG